jgi:hypothetical protein
MDITLFWGQKACQAALRMRCRPTQRKRDSNMSDIGKPIQEAERKSPQDSPVVGDGR